VRERCSDAGTWQKETFVCAVDITGSQESALACAVKSDGRITCFGSSSFDDYFAPLIAIAPAAKWSKLFLADDLSTNTDHQLCGIDQSGGGWCWGISYDARSIGRSKLVANGSEGFCVVGDSGNWSCPATPTIAGQEYDGTDRVVDLQMRSGLLFGLHVDGSVLVPFSNYLLPGVFTRISASNLELCALRQDGTLVCAINNVPSALASQHFLDLAVGSLGGLCAIRAEDQTIVCDPLGDSFDIVPPDGKFTRLTVVRTTTVCGIRVDGSIACAGSAEVKPPAEW